MNYYLLENTGKQNTTSVVSLANQSFLIRKLSSNKIYVDVEYDETNENHILIPVEPFFEGVFLTGWNYRAGHYVYESDKLTRFEKRMRKSFPKVITKSLD